MCSTCITLSRFYDGVDMLKCYRYTNAVLLGYRCAPAVYIVIILRASALGLVKTFNVSRMHVCLRGRNRNPAADV